jgi:aminoglycoside phosphotransferase (APT) family kinase protein
VTTPRRPDPDIIDVRPGEDLDWPRLEEYLRLQITELEGDFNVAQFPHGSANLTFLVSIGSARLVVRRPPFGRIGPGAHDMGREFRALSGLWPVFDRVARPYLHCTDRSIVGSEFLVMEFREGIVVWDEIPAVLADFDRPGLSIGLALAETLADLHSIDPAETELHSFGRPDGYLERQVSGWRKRWELVDSGRSPLMTAIAGKLATTLPSQTGRPAIIHNDFKVNNCQFDARDISRVKTVFDWEMSTVGDPLADLGTMLNFWPDEARWNGPLPHSPGVNNLGLTPRAPLLEAYAARTGFDLQHLDWYEALAAFKHATILEQLYQRYVRGESSDPRMIERGSHVAELADHAAQLLGIAPI